jgi:hypothetical protein
LLLCGVVNSIFPSGLLSGLRHVRVWPVRVDLSAVDLSPVALSVFDLFVFDLSVFDLSVVDLPVVDLSVFDLSVVELSVFDLSVVDLSAACSFASEFQCNFVSMYCSLYGQTLWILLSVGAENIWKAFDVHQTGLCLSGPFEWIVPTKHIKILKRFLAYGLKNLLLFPKKDFSDWLPRIRGFLTRRQATTKPVIKN